MIAMIVLFPLIPHSTELDCDVSCYSSLKGILQFVLKARCQQRKCRYSIVSSKKRLKIPKG